MVKCECKFVITILHNLQINVKTKQMKGAKKMKREEKGITLIALVITIIVLLILAGVSIAMLTRTKWNTNKSS